MMRTVTAAVMVAVMLETYTTVHGTMIADPSHQNYELRDPKPNNTAANLSLDADKQVSDNEKIAAFMGIFLIIVISIFVCRCVCYPMLKPQPVSNAAWNRMLRNDRYPLSRQDIIRWQRESQRRNSPTDTFPFPPSTNEIPEQDPFWREVRENLHAQLEGESYLQVPATNPCTPPETVTIYSPD